ncbi:MAG: hypothetical protein LBI54_00545 [Lachnospiraceae bacterium]|nr:hypothetical protein [Lachnospiraceae bacterium]
MKNKMEKLDNWIHDIIEKYFFYIAMAVFLLLSAAIRWKLAPVVAFSGDYYAYLLPWVEHYRDNGLIEGLRLGVEQYIPYNLFLAIVAWLPGEPWAYIALLLALFLDTNLLCIGRVVGDTGGARGARSAADLF